MSLLEVENLSVGFDTMRGPLKAVDRLSLAVDEGETLGIVGESGCGKSITSLALMGLLPPNAKVSADRMRFQGQELLSLSEAKRRQIRGGAMAMIFQDPMSSLNPSFTVGFQLAEALQTHGEVSRAGVREKTLEALAQVGIPDPESRLRAYPHQLSGGMCQRVMIAMALVCRPRLLIADEPTTALDVTIQTQILALLKDLQRQYRMGLILITHDIGVVSQMADRVMVMYAGQAVETGRARDVILRPSHPYTEGLLSCLPASHAQDEEKSLLPSILGLVPDLVNRPAGCQMNPRCKYVDDSCRRTEPPYAEVGDKRVRCIRPLNASDGAPRPELRI
ncbi:MAG: ABC transporter ATP-binding protein [Bacteriovoracia bacterium]